MKLLAVDTQTFSDMRERNALYLDKTNYIYKMVTGGKVYFLSRPRRFGKSLMVSTRESLFEGRFASGTPSYMLDIIRRRKVFTCSP
ncbi:MAG: AAA family ATPase [Dysgonamonadaceae bacterium]|jgi:hypothetical protein|nr:AAA family ATPase [Dysgonamonadaceae bacterium]